MLREGIEDVDNGLDIGVEVIAPLDSERRGVSCDFDDEIGLRDCEVWDDEMTEKPMLDDREDYLFIHVRGFSTSMIERQRRREE